MGIEVSLSLDSYLGMVTSVLGDRSQATEFSERALRAARASGSAFTSAISLALASMAYTFARAYADVREVTVELIDVAERYHLADFHRQAKVANRWAAANESSAAPGSAAQSQPDRGGCDLPVGGGDNDSSAVDTGSLQLNRPIFLGLMAEICWQGGRFDEALVCVDAAPA
jgi:hypothetical protein